MKNPELTDAMIRRNDEIDNAVYALILTLTEKTAEDLPWNMEIIADVTQAAKYALEGPHGLPVRHPGVLTHTDGRQSCEEYDNPHCTCKEDGVL